MTGQVDHQVPSENTLEAKTRRGLAELDRINLEFFQSPVIQALLNLPEDSEAVIPSESFFLYSLIQVQWVEKDSSDDNPSTLKANEKALLRLANSIDMCETGKKEKIVKIYTINDSPHKLTKEGLGDDVEIGCKARQSLIKFTQVDILEAYRVKAIEILQSKEFLVRLGIPANKRDYIHESKYLRNKFGPKIYLEDDLDFDYYTGGLPDNIFDITEGKFYQEFWNLFQLEKFLVEQLNTLKERVLIQSKEKQIYLNSTDEQKKSLRFTLANGENYNIHADLTEILDGRVKADEIFTTEFDEDAGVNGYGDFIINDLPTQTIKQLALAFGFIEKAPETVKFPRCTSLDEFRKNKMLFFDQTIRNYDLKKVDLTEYKKISQQEFDDLFGFLLLDFDRQNNLRARYPNKKPKLTIDIRGCESISQIEISGFMYDLEFLVNPEQEIKYSFFLVNTFINTEKIADNIPITTAGEKAKKCLSKSNFTLNKKGETNFSQSESFSQLLIGVIKDLNEMKIDRKNIFNLVFNKYWLTNGRSVIQTLFPCTP